MIVADFVSMVNKVRHSTMGSKYKFQSCVRFNFRYSNYSQNISPKDMKNMVLVILSDMQIDMANTDNTIEWHIQIEMDNMDTMFEMMKNKYHDAGLRTIHQEPYELPHIVFWNLRSTTGFPSIINNSKYNHDEWK